MNPILLLTAFFQACLLQRPDKILLERHGERLDPGGILLRIHHSHDTRGSPFRTHWLKDGARNQSLAYLNIGNAHTWGRKVRKNVFGKKIQQLQMIPWQLIRVPRTTIFFNFATRDENCLPIVSFTSRWGAWSLFALRVLQGLVSGVTYPSLPPIVKRWSLASELSSFIAVSYVGGTFGTCVTYPIGGIILQHWGWEVRT